MNELENIINGCINKDAKSQEQLFIMFGKKMLGICARYCRNLEDARDAMQDGFVKVFKSIQSFKGDSKFETWMTRLMVYTAIDNFKKNARWQLYENEDMTKMTESTEEYEYELEDKSDLKFKLVECLNLLPDGYKMIFNLHTIDGLTHAEIAEELDITEGTSKSQLARAKKKLQEIVKERLGIEQGSQIY